MLESELESRQVRLGKDCAEDKLKTKLEYLQSELGKSKAKDKMEKVHCESSYRFNEDTVHQFGD